MRAQVLAAAIRFVKVKGARPSRIQVLQRHPTADVNLAFLCTLPQHDIEHAFDPARILEAVCAFLAGFKAGALALALNVREDGLVSACLRNALLGLDNTPAAPLGLWLALSLREGRVPRPAELLRRVVPPPVDGRGGASGLQTFEEICHRLPANLPLFAVAVAVADVLGTATGATGHAAAGGPKAVPERVTRFHACLLRLQLYGGCVLY